MMSEERMAEEAIIARRIRRVRRALRPLHIDRNSGLGVLLPLRPGHMPGLALLLHGEKRIVIQVRYAGQAAYCGLSGRVKAAYGFVSHPRLPPAQKPNCTRTAGVRAPRT